MQSNMSSGPEAVLHTFDFTAIDELDPSIGMFAIFYLMVQPMVIVLFLTEKLLLS